MSASTGQGSPQAPSVPANWLMAPVAAWRILRVLAFLVKSVLLSRTAWPRLNEAERQALTRQWAGHLIAIMGVRLDARGQAQAGAKLVVANHVSWLDIMAIDAVLPSRFVSKAEVGQWPLVGRLVSFAGTLFIVRERRRDAMRVLGQMTHALREGDTVCVFPEGTTGSGHGVMHFHGNLLQAAIDAGVPIQPIVIRYSEPDHAISPRAAYIGDTSLMQSLWWIVSARGLRVHVHVLPVIDPADADRRSLAHLLHSHIAQDLARQVAKG